MSEKAAKCILSVDDDLDQLRLIRRWLTNRGYNVLMANHGREALFIINHTKPDLILLDVSMPDLNGYEICSRLQTNQETAYIPVVFLTALSANQNKAMAFSVGGVDYLSKPIKKESLLSTVDHHLQTSIRWKGLRHPGVTCVRRKQLTTLLRFKEFLSYQIELSPRTSDQLFSTEISTISGISSLLKLTNSQLARYAAQCLGIPYHPTIDPSHVELGILPTAFCETNNVIILKEPRGRQVCVMSNPFDLETLDSLETLVGNGTAYTLAVTDANNISVLFEDKGKSTGSEVSLADIEELVQRAYGRGEQIVDIAEDSNEESEPIILLVNKIIANACQMGASDIHIEPQRNEIIVRNRVDGDLYETHHIRPRSLIRPIAARIKIMSQLDITERRLPQDGRIVFNHCPTSGLHVDLRVSIAPMSLGDKVVLRILDKQRAVLPLEKLGFSPNILRTYRQVIQTPQGMILHVGPTGSGKSLTLYSALNEIQKPEINIQTIEDPIEYTLDGINQLQVHKEIGLTFARALRSFLRQDPDVILVGEIRDRETADIAVGASLTGHLLLSTLHTNDTASAITRLIEMGIEPYLISSSLLGVCAQRLLRRLCTRCREAFNPTERERSLVGIPFCQ